MKIIKLLILSLILALLTLGAVSADDDLQTTDSGQVSGDVDVAAFSPWNTTGELTYDIPDEAREIRSAEVYVNVYSGGYSNTYGAMANVSLETVNGENLIGNEELWTEEGSSDATIYTVNNHTSKCYTDYQIYYNITDLVKGLNGSSITLKVDTFNMTDKQFDGRIKMIALVLAYDDGDDDNISYWVDATQKWTQTNVTTTFNTANVTGITKAELTNIALASTDGNYTINGQLLADPNYHASGYYYQYNYWDITQNLTEGQNTQFTTICTGGAYSSMKNALSVLTIESVPIEVNVSLKTEFTSVPTCYAGTNNTLTITATASKSGRYTIRLYADDLLVEIVDADLDSSNTNIRMTDPTIRPIDSTTVNGANNTHVTYTALVIFNDKIVALESIKVPVLYNGYLGHGMEYNVTGFEEIPQSIITGDIVIDIKGESSYIGGSAMNRTDMWIVDWDGYSEIADAYIFIPYNWFNPNLGNETEDMFYVVFNDCMFPASHHYRDQSNLGNLGRYGYGVLIYNVKNLINLGGSNTLTIVKKNATPSLYPSVLVYTYNTPGGAPKAVSISMGADLLSDNYNYAGRTVKSNSQINVTGDYSAATLYVLAASAQKGEGNIIINGEEYSDVWSGTSKTTDLFTADITGIMAHENNISFVATGSSILALPQIIVTTLNAPTVTNATFFNYFDENGVLRNISNHELYFDGDFTGLNVTNITINKPIILQTDNALFNNVSFIIASDNVTMDGFRLTQKNGTKLFDIRSVRNITLSNNEINFTAVEGKDSYAVFANACNNLNFYNNRLNYVGNTVGTSINNGVLINKSGNVTFKGNNFYIVMPSTDVIYDNVTLASLPCSGGLMFMGCDGVLFTQNTVLNNFEEYYGYYDTLYCLVFGDSFYEFGDNTIFPNQCRNVTVSNNAIYVNGHGYTYGITIAANNSIIRDNVVNVSSNLYACGIQIDGPSSGINVKSNAINITSERYTYGIYSYRIYGDINNMSYINNAIDARSYASCGIEAVERNPTISQNHINVYGNYTTGIVVKPNSNSTISDNEIGSFGSDVGNESTGDMYILKESTGIYLLGADCKITGNTISSTGKSMNITENNTLIIDNNADSGIYVRSGSNVIENNTITTTDIYAIDLTISKGNTVRYNELYANMLYGDDAVKSGDESNIIENNLPRDGNMTFQALQNLINRAGSEVNITGNYTFTAGDPEFILINKSITIRGNGFTIDGTNSTSIFKIISDNVTIEGFRLTQKSGKKLFDIAAVRNITLSNNEISFTALPDEDGYAIYANGTSGLNLINNTVRYVGNTAGEGINNAVYLNNTNDANIAGNTFNLSLVSCYVDWREIPAGSGNWVSFYLSGGIVVENSNNVLFKDNEVNVNYTNVVGSYDPIYSLSFKNTDNTTITCNEINAYGHTYVYGIQINGENFNISENIILTTSDNYYACCIDVEGPSNGIICENGLFAEATTSAYGIYSGMNGFECTNEYFNNYIGGRAYSVFGMCLGDVKSTIDGNNFMLVGNYTTGIAFRGSNIIVKNNEIELNSSQEGNESIWEYFDAETIGIKIIANQSTLSNNTIYANNGIEFREIAIYSNVNINVTDIAYGEDAIIKVTLPSDATGNVTVTVGGIDYIKGIIDGTATFSIPNLEAGTYQVSVAYSGDEIFMEASSTATFNVTDGSKTFEELQELIYNANPGDIINISGIYKGSGYRIDINKQVTIIGDGETVLDAQSLSGILYISAENVRIENVKFQNGYNPGDWGGAIYWEGDNGILLNSTFINNRASWGAGIFWWATDGYMENCTFENNTAQRYGGALYVNGEHLRMISTLYKNNVVSGPVTQWEGGGAIYADGHNHVIANSTFIENKAVNSWGGALKHGDGTVTYQSNEFYNNTAIKATAIYLNDPTCLINNTFNMNSADEIATCIEEADLSAVFDSNTFKIKGNKIAKGDYFGSTTFEDLKTIIENANEGDIITLNADYVNDGSTSSEGITISKSITIDGKGHTLDANKTSRIFTIVPESVTLKNIVFKNGNEGFGGALYHKETENYQETFSSKILNCSFINCSGYQGGAINWAANTLSVEASEFINCSASDSGGGIYFWIYANGVVSDSLFINCTAEDGAAIHYLSDMGTVSNCAFAKCTSESGKVLLLSDEISVSGCTIDGESMKKTEPDMTISANDMEYGENAVITATLPSSATGKVTFTLYKANTLVSNVTEDIASGIASHDFGKLKLGTYRIDAAYGGGSSYLKTSKSQTFTVMAKVIIEENVPAGSDVNVYMSLDKITDTILIKVDGRVADVLDINDGIVNQSIKTTRYTPGNHVVTFSYDGNKFDESGLKGEYSMYLAEEEIPVPKEIDVKEDEFLSLPMPINATGNLTIFINGEAVEVLDIAEEMAKFLEETGGNVSEIVMGILKIDLSKYKGKYTITFEYSGDDNYRAFTKETNVTVQEKNPSIVTSNMNTVYTAGPTYTIKVYEDTGVLANGAAVVVKVNGKSFQTLRTNANGIASFKVSQIPGTYKLTITSLGATVTKTLTVKHLVTLKTATIKKSAKKLTLQATLAKVNGKYLKNKKITFKFNNKKYTAKTNKKGVAKVTIKSSVLKKLKVGKKVTYQATYSKDTVKKTAKVKK